jgi:hypothetical protein
VAGREGGRERRRERGREVGRERGREGERERGREGERAGTEMRLNEISTLCEGNVTDRDCPGRVSIQKSQIEIAQGG